VEFILPKFKSVVFLFFMQITYGAFVAGMKAGFAFNTFPLMAGTFAPPNLWEFEPWVSNLVSNPATVQWIHRCLGWTVLFSSVWLWITLRYVKRVPRSEVRIWTTAVAHMTIIQFLLGVATLVYGVPVALGAIHQFGAAVIVILLTLLARALKIESGSGNLNAYGTSESPRG
jgi:cytochrome c oxidase assembly protein subunit 15